MFFWISWTFISKVATYFKLCSVIQVIQATKISDGPMVLITLPFTLASMTSLLQSWTPKASSTTPLLTSTRMEICSHFNSMNTSFLALKRLLSTILSNGYYRDSQQRQLNWQRWAQNKNSFMQATSSILKRVAILINKELMLELSDLLQQQRVKMLQGSNHSK